MAGALVALWACGGDGPAGPPPPPLTALRVRLEGSFLPATATADTLVEGSQIGITVRGVTRDGRDTTVTAATLSTSNEAVLSLGDLVPDGSLGHFGTATARDPGRVVLAAQVGAVHGELAVTVLRGQVGQVQMRAANDAVLSSAVPDSVPVRTSRRYGTAVFARLRSGQTGGRLLGRAAAWTTSDSTVARVSPDGVLEGRREGAVMLRAEVEGVADSTRVVVRPPLAARIAFALAPDSVRVRRSDSVRVVLYDSAGAPTALQARLIIQPALASIGVTPGAATLSEGPASSTAVVVTGGTAGSTELVASGDGLTVRRALAVVALPQGPPGTYPATVSAVAGTAVLLAARGLDIDGFGLAAPVPVAYASSDPGIAAVSTAGVVTARAPGATVIRVTTGATHTDVPVTVLAAGGFAMTFRSARATPLPPALDVALRTAAAGWERAVIGDLPDLRLTLPPGACDMPTITEELSIDDLLVFASADSIDGPGGVLAQAGPCIIRGDGSAAAGRIQVDSADIAALTARGQLATVLEHELGHVLGIGTLWSRPSLGFVTRSGITTFRYVGPRGLRVSDWWALGPLGGAPLGEANGPGAGHWDEATFRNELMTPVLNTGVNPLSLLTIEALADLGYVTAAAGAEAYALYLGAPATLAARLSPSRAVAPAVGGAGAAFDRLLVPRWRVSGSGRVQVLPIGVGR